MCCHCNAAGRCGAAGRKARARTDADEADGAVGGVPSEAERGVMYERVADQLAAIADNYELMSPHSPDDGELTLKVLTGYMCCFWCFLHPRG